MNKIKITLCMIFSGLGVGWLIGVSVSPVLHIVVTGVITLIVGAVSALSGLSNDDDKQRGKLSGIDPFPISVLMIGIVAGSITGVWARTNDWMGINPDFVAKKWEVSGIAKNTIVTRLFDYRYPPFSNATKETSNPAPGTQGAAVLYKVSSDDCSSLLGLHGEKLRQKLKSVLNANSTTIHFLNSLDSLQLNNFQEVLCPNK